MSRLHLLLSSPPAIGSRDCARRSLSRQQLSPSSRQSLCEVLQTTFNVPHDIICWCLSILPSLTWPLHGGWVCLKRATVVKLRLLELLRNRRVDSPVFTVPWAASWLRMPSHSWKYPYQSARRLEIAGNT